jgi:hypothetical protein
MMLLLLLAAALAVPCVAQAPQRHFGYYYALEPNGTIAAAAADHSTTTFVDPPGDLGGNASAATLASLARANLTGVLCPGGVFLDPHNSTALLDGWEARWDTYWRAIKPHARAILAWYPVDEPSPGLIASGAYGTLVRAIKKTTPTVPIAAVITASAVKGIEFGAYDLPAEVDWIGFDNYGCWAEAECAHGDCCWENRTIPHNLNVLVSYAKRRGPTSRVVLVPDGVASPTVEQRKHGQKALPTAAQQSVRAARDRKYFEWCMGEDLCAAMWVFLWRSVHTSTGWLTGVEDQEEVLLPALSKIGKAIKRQQHTP